jgi:hypothetical protein
VPQTVVVTVTWPWTVVVTVTWPWTVVTVTWPWTVVVTVTWPWTIVTVTWPWTGRDNNTFCDLLWDSQPPFQSVADALFPRAKWPGHEAVYVRLNMWSYTSIHLARTGTASPYKIKLKYVSCGGCTCGRRSAFKDSTLYVVINNYRQSSYVVNRFRLFISHHQTKIVRFKNYNESNKYTVTNKSQINTDGN